MEIHYFCEEKKRKSLQSIHFHGEIERVTKVGKIVLSCLLIPTQQTLKMNENMMKL